MDAEQPRAVPSGVVEALVASTDNSGTVQFDRDLEIGQKVRILSGPFEETICQLVHLDDRGRVRVLLQFMGVEVAAQLHQSCVVRAASVLLLRFAVQPSLSNGSRAIALQRGRSS